MCATQWLSVTCEHMWFLSETLTSLKPFPAVSLINFNWSLLKIYDLYAVYLILPLRTCLLKILIYFFNCTFSACLCRLEVVWRSHTVCKTNSKQTEDILKSETDILVWFHRLVCFLVNYYNQLTNSHLQMDIPYNIIGWNLKHFQYNFILRTITLWWWIQTTDSIRSCTCMGACVGKCIHHISNCMWLICRHWQGQIQVTVLVWNYSFSKIKGVEKWVLYQLSPLHCW